jgi:ABC-2 type transport system permease protein
MRKYWHATKIGLQNNLAYRVNFLARALFGLIPLVAILSLWQKIYAGKAPGDLVAGYTLAQMISYYLLVTVVDALTAVNEDDWQIAADIKDGNISQFLLKPIDYLGYRLCLFFAGRIGYLAIAALPLALFILYWRAAFVLPASWATLGLFLVSALFTALLQFFISYTLAMLAFWVLEVSTFIFIVFAFEYLASGHLFPLDILPPVVAKVLAFTPFPYQLYFPISVYLGKVTGPELWRGLAIQLFWVVFVFGLARFAWARGIKRYAAVGG